ncbi:MAG TPA: hypothetical protein DEP05_00050 [Betaproteobacteria bacterium]|nr:hypothetical protein [Betaproteobacteria bacterium]
MRFVPSWLPPVAAPEHPLDVNALRRVGPAKRTGERTLPPLIRRAAQRRNGAPAREEGVGQSSRERRRFCRRVSRRALLLELRGGADRRRGKRRRNDLTARIDEKV